MKSQFLRSENNIAEKKNEIEQDFFFNHSGFWHVKNVAILKAKRTLLILHGSHFLFRIGANFTKNTHVKINKISRWVTLIVSNKKLWYYTYNELTGSQVNWLRIYKV